MLNVYSRHRSFALLIAVVFAQVLLLAFQIKRDRDVPLIRYWAADLVTPVGRVGTWTSFQDSRRLDRLHRSPRRPRRKMRACKANSIGCACSNHELETEAAEAQPPAAAPRFPRGSYGSPDARGSGDRCERRPVVSHAVYESRLSATMFAAIMAVITPDGIVGKIVEVFNTPPPRCFSSTIRTAAPGLASRTRARTAS